MTSLSEERIPGMVEPLTGSDISREEHGNEGWVDFLDDVN